jgi:hypothetical protein
MTDVSKQITGNGLDGSRVYGLDQRLLGPVFFYLSLIASSLLERCSIERGNAPLRD